MRTPARPRRTHAARWSTLALCAALLAPGAAAQTRSLFEARHGVVPDLSERFRDNPGGQRAFEAAYTPLCADGTRDAIARARGRCDDGSDPILCADGTRPLFYWDAGDGPGRNHWIVFAGQGGANCSSVAAPGKPDCWQLYLEDPTHFNNGLDVDDGAFTYPARFNAASGILRPDDPPLRRPREVGESEPGDCDDGDDNDHDGRTDADDPKCALRQDNPFKHFNRVVVDKCTPDLWTGRRARAPYDSPGPAAEDGGVDETFGACGDGEDNDRDGLVDCDDPQCECASGMHVNYQGHLIVEQVLRRLQSAGIASSDPDGGDLPGLDDADLLLFAAHSGGSRGLAYNLDHWHDFVTVELGIPARVKGLFSSSEMFGIRTEKFFAAGLDPGADSIYQMPWRTFRPLPVSFEGARCRGRAAEDDGCFNAYTYRRGKTVADLLEWGTVIDSSCRATHRRALEHCADPAHLRQNHLSTPFFLNKSQTDPSPGAATLPYCQVRRRDASYDCDYGAHPGLMQKLLRKQLADVHLDAQTARCEPGAYPYDESVIFTTASPHAVHAGYEDDDVFFGSFVRGNEVVEFRAPPADGVCARGDLSLEDALVRWLVTGRKALYMDDAQAAVLTNRELGVCP